MSKKRSSYSMRKNAIRGAITRWCPECKRKAALDAFQKCLYCGAVWRGRGSQHQALYDAWIKSKEQPA